MAAAHTTYHLSSPSCLTRAMLRSPSLNKRMSENVWRIKLYRTCGEEKPTLVFFLTELLQKGDSSCQLTQDTILRERAVAHSVAGLAWEEVVQWYVRLLVNLLVMQHVVAVTEHKRASLSNHSSFRCLILPPQK